MALFQKKNAQDRLNDAKRAAEAADIAVTRAEGAFAESATDSNWRAVAEARDAAARASVVLNGARRAADEEAMAKERAVRAAKEKRLADLRKATTHEALYADLASDAKEIVDFETKFGMQIMPRMRGKFDRYEAAIDEAKKLASELGAEGHTDGRASLTWTRIQTAIQGAIADAHVKTGRNSYRDGTHVWLDADNNARAEWPR